MQALIKKYLIHEYKTRNCFESRKQYAGIIAIIFGRT